MAIGWQDGDGASLRAAVDELIALLVAEERLEAVLDRVAQLACDGIGACDLASVTTLEAGVFCTLVSTEPAALEIDQAQYDSDTGPCLDAFRQNHVVSVESMSEGDGWREFRTAAIERDVHASLSLPMTAGEKRVGALNLYTRTDHGFRSVAPDAALLFAKQAAAAVLGARTYGGMREVIGHLETALETRDLIGVAKGVIMANERVRADEAFDILVAASQHRNVKVRDLAVEVAATGATPTRR